MNKYLIKNKKRGYLGVEVIIVAAIMLIAGSIGLMSALSNNQQAGNFINAGLSSNVISENAIGVDIVSEEVEMGLGNNASILLQWVYKPYPSRPTATPTNISWTANPSNVISIDSNGRMTATSEGTTTVTLSVTVGGNIWKDTVYVRVVDKDLRDYIIRKNESPISGTLDIAYTNVLTYEYLPWDATILSSSVSVANTSIATASIDPASQTITIAPRALGPTTVTVNIDGVSKVIPINVTMVPVVIPVTAVDVKDGGNSVNFVTVSGSKQLSLHVYPSDATNQDATLTVGDTGIIAASINNTTKIITINQVSIGTTSLTVRVDGETKVLSITTAGTILRDFNILKGSTVVASDWINTNTSYNIQFIPVEALNANISATSSNPGIATVSVNNTLKTFTVNPVTDGSSTITVQVGSFTKTLQITVSGIRVKSINIKDGDANIISVAFTGTKTLSIEVLPSTASNKNFTATIGNTSVATVTANNTNRTVTLTSVAASGDTTLTITADGVSTVIPIKVIVIPLEGIDIRDGSTPVSSASVGATKDFNVVFTPANATYSQDTVSITGFDSTIITPSYLAGTKQLRIVPLKAGTTTLTLSIGGRTDSLTVTVPAILATSLEIRYGGVSIVSDSINSTRTYSVVTTPSTTTNTVMTVTSSNTAVATASVSGSTGRDFTITPIANGTTTITVRNLASGVTDTLTVTVYGFRVESINFKDGTTTVNSISISAPKTLGVEILPATATNKTISATVAHASIASVTIDNVNKTITVSPISAGTTSVTATVDGVSRVLTVTVSTIPVTGISISGSSSVLTGTRTLTATINPANATNKGVVWSTSNSARISISSTTGGSITITARGNGSATITARSAENSAISATITINSDVGQLASSLKLGDTVYDAGTVNRLVDLNRIYGTAYLQTGNWVAAPSYYVWVIESSWGYSNRGWSTNSTAVNYWATGTIGANLEGVSHPSAVFNSKMVRVYIPIMTRLNGWPSDSTYLARGLFLPSISELGFNYLGYEPDGNRPYREGNPFAWYASTGRLSASSGAWTRSRVVGFFDTYETSRAVVYFGKTTSPTRSTITTSFAVRPAFASQHDFLVSYYKNASGHYEIR